jgi:hypothetical protein
MSNRPLALGALSIWLGGCALPIDGALDSNPGTEGEDVDDDGRVVFLQAGLFADEAVAVHIHEDGEPAPGFGLGTPFGEFEIVSGAEGREVWVLRDGYVLRHAVVEDEAVPTALPRRLLPILEDPDYAETEDDLISFVLVARPASEVYWTTEDYPIRLEAAGALGDDGAWGETVALKRLDFCPLSRESCLVYGPPAEVFGAEGFEPTGGWVVEADDAAPSDGAAFTEERRVPFNRAGDAIVVETAEGSQTHETVYSMRVETARWVSDPVFVSHSPSVVGAELVDGRLLVWSSSDDVAMAAFLLDPASGEPVGEPLRVVGEPFFEILCGEVYSTTRLLPAVTDRGIVPAIAFADWDGTEGDDPWIAKDALIFEHLGEAGVFAPYHGGAEIAPLRLVDGALGGV